MRRVAEVLMLILGVCLFAPAALAADQGGGGAGANWVAITSGFAMAIASGLCGLAQGRASAGASEGFARNPAASTVIQNMLILSLVLIESMALYTFIIIFVKVK